jgi:hypothetical protein
MVSTGGQLMSDSVGKVGIHFFFAPVYLNADFAGGELVFPDVDVVSIPKPGLLVGFPTNY